ncbi:MULTISPECIES: hypothetical protein [Deinococcus]|uniref:Uncharacterized protein n=1 Tax=Deinococcus phoenicis TaxID=1476583 RepID=A0A016QJG4_9DEIO|nr:MULTISPECIES: hypothetical protein [Deinococcus]EYB66315.1 hypothetical protein DEIPH_ctg139orf0030 [Deinococcus phoenicis]MBI0445531.1 hypothetical protein [Deinococcus sp. DB0503]
MKQRRKQVALLVPANGLVDLAVAFVALRHRHALLAPMYGALGVSLLLSHVQKWRWHPRQQDLLYLSVGLGLALGFLITEVLALT